MQNADDELDRFESSLSLRFYCNDHSRRCSLLCAYYRAAYKLSVLFRLCFWLIPFDLCSI